MIKTRFVICFCYSGVTLLIFVLLSYTTLFMTISEGRSLEKLLGTKVVRRISMNNQLETTIRVYRFFIFSFMVIGTTTNSEMILFLRLF